jgi:hypothetical protein
MEGTLLLDTLDLFFLEIAKETIAGVAAASGTDVSVEEVGIVGSVVAIVAAIVIDGEDEVLFSLLGMSASLVILLVLILLLLFVAIVVIDKIVNWYSV